MPYITSQLQHVTRLDIIWDMYMPESLKADTHSKIDKGVMRRVDPSSAIPGNWQAFLRIDNNKRVVLLPGNERSRHQHQQTCHHHIPY